MPLLAGITSFFDRYVLGYALGTAAGPSLEPFVQDLANEAWAATQLLPLDAEIAAAVAAEDVDAYDRMAAEATLTGLNGARFKDLWGEVLNAPGLGELFEAWRRDLIDDAAFEHGLRKAKLETRWDAPLKGLKERLLSSEELANAQQQEFIDEARANEEAGLQGVTPERQQIRYKLAGLPPGVETGLQMLRRGIITTSEFSEIVATGHTKTKWTPQLLELQAQVLGAQTYAGLHLRGWIDEAAMVTGGALTGHDKEQMDLLYKEHGRPATGHQVFIGLRRGGTYNGPTAGIDQAFIDAIRQSNIRPEWTNLLWAGRYTYPSAFVLRSLTQSGDLSQADTEKILLYEGWEPGLAKQVSSKWAGGSASGADSHVTKAQTQLWSRLHTSYIADESAAGVATATLGLLGVDAAAQPQILALWDAEKSLIRKQLSPADVRKAYQKQDLNVATGAAWTREDAKARLIELGYDAEDADNYLNIG